jgi:hypothetical protein
LFEMKNSVINGDVKGAKEIGIEFFHDRSLSQVLRMHMDRSGCS